MADRKLVIQILGDSRQLERTFARTSRDATSWGKSLERVGRGGLVATVGFRGLGRSVAFASGAFLGGAGFVAGARAAIKASSDLAEEQNKTAVLFGKSADEIKRWAQTTAVGIGISQRAAQQAAGNFGAMFETLNLGDKAATTMSKRLVTLGADLASFANEDPSDMLDRLRSGLSGEAEPLRRFGILLSEARVKQEAYRSGIAKTGATLTEQQKVLARFNLILADSTAAQGDFARTSQSQANQERINAALREEAAERIGRVLLPLYNQATRAVNKWLGEEENLAQIQRTTQNIVTTSTKVVKAFVDVAKEIAPVLQRTNKLLGGTESAVKLLLTVFVVGKIVSFAVALRGLGVQATATSVRVKGMTATMTTAGNASVVAAGKVNVLRGALLRLAAIGVITLGVEVILNRKEIHDKVEGFLQKHASFLVPDGLKIPLDIDAASLQVVRDRLADIKGEGDATVVILDRFIKKLREAGRAGEKLGGERGKGAAGAGRGPTGVAAVVTAAEKEAAALEDAERAAARSRRAFDAFVKGMGLKLDKAAITESLNDDLAALRELERAILRRIEIEGRTFKLEQQLTDVRAEIASTSASQRAANAQKAIDAYSALIDSLNLNLERAQVTTSLVDDLAALREIESAIRKRIAAEGRTAALTRELFQNRQEQAALIKEQAEKARDRRQANQFKMLGLTAEGEKRAPGIEALKGRFASLREQVKGTFLDTDKTQRDFAGIAKVLALGPREVGRKMRLAILEMFNDISSALDEKKGPLTKFRVANFSDIAKLFPSLTEDELKNLRRQLARRGAGGVTARSTTTGGAFGFEPRAGGGFGTGNTIITGPVTVVANDPDEFHRQLAKRKRRNAGSRTGPRAGSIGGV